MLNFPTKNKMIQTKYMLLKMLASELKKVNKLLFVAGNYIFLIAKSNTLL